MRSGKGSERRTTWRPRSAAAEREHTIITPWGSWWTSAAGKRSPTPWGVPLSGPVAKAITRGYHLYALPGGRLRVATDWLDGRLSHPPMVQFGLVPEPQLRP